MIKKLSARGQGKADEVDVERMLEDGELEQISVELSRVEDTKVSFDFAQQILGRTPPFYPPKRDRRAEGMKA